MVLEQPPFDQQRRHLACCFAGILCLLAATWLLAVCCKQVQVLQTVRKAMKDLQGKFATAVASQVGGAEVACSVCGHAMLADVQHHCGTRAVSGPPLFGIMPDVEVSSAALQRSSQAAVGVLKAELQHQARILQGTLGAQQASQTEVSRLL